MLPVQAVWGMRDASFVRSASTTADTTPLAARSRHGSSSYTKQAHSAEAAVTGESTGSSTAGSVIATSMAAEAAAISSLRRAHIIPRSDRNSESATQVWTSYMSLSPATRRALTPAELRSILRAVVPGKQYLGSFFAGRAETARVRGIRKRVAKRYEHRLRTVINDMRNRVPAAESSSSAAAAATVAGVCPNRADYYFAMWCMGTARNMRSTEAIWTEAQSVISERLGPMFTRLRLRAAYFSLEDSIDFGAPLSAKRKLEPITTVLWDALAEFRNDPIARRRHTVSLLIKALGLAKTAFAPFKKHVKSYDDAMAYLMRAAYGIDMRYFTVPPPDGKSTLPVTADVLKALLDHLGEKGEVWRMISAFEMLGERSARYEEFAEAFEEDEDDFGPTLSQMEAEEKESRRGMRFFSAAKATDASPAPISQSDPLPDSATAIAPSENEADRSCPIYTPFLPRAPTLRDVLARGGNTPSSPAIQSINTNTYMSLLDGVAAAGDKDLTSHYLRAALRHAEETSSVWLAQALQYASLLHGQQAAAGESENADSSLPAGRPVLPAKVHAPLVAVSKAWFLPVLRLHRDRGTLSERQRIFALLEHALLMVDKEIRILSGGLEPDLLAIEAEAVQAAIARDQIEAISSVDDEIPVQVTLAAADADVAQVEDAAAMPITTEAAAAEPVVLASGLRNTIWLGRRGWRRLDGC